MEPLETPGGLLAKDARRLAVLVTLDHTACDLEVAARAGERRRVEPKRVVVLRDQRRWARAGDGVEILLCRLAAAGPVAASPAVAAQHVTLYVGVAHTPERLVERRAAVELHLVLRDCPGREVDVRVGEAGEDAAAAEVDRLGACERGLVHADPARDAVAGDCQRARDRQGRVERANDAVVEDHGASLTRGARGRSEERRVGKE